MAVIPESYAPPAAPFTDRELRLAESFVWLEKFGKTPADLGLTWDRVDRAWRSAMMWIKAGYETQRAFDLNRHAPGEI